jgi:hypothetical protein
VDRGGADRVTGPRLSRSEVLVHLAVVVVPLILVVLAVVMGS